MNALFRWLDVDRVQWRALLRASLRTDLAALGSQAGGAKARPWATLAMSFLLYFLAGISPAIVADRASDPLLAATVMVTVVAFMVGSSLLVGEGMTILSPNDHHVLGFRPVTSRTYLAVRVASLLVRTTAIATCVAVPAVVVFATKGGFDPLRGLAALVAAYAAGLAITLAIVSMYGWLLRLAGPSRMARYAMYVQFAAQFVVWGGFILVTQDLLGDALVGLSLSDSPWSLLYPGAWFGAYVGVVTGAPASQMLIAIALSLALIAGLWRSISGKLALGYAESLGRVAATAAKRVQPQTRSGRWLRFLDDESRAMAILVRSHMQHDIKFRLGVISLIPITLLYILMGGWPSDPFVPGASREGDTPVIQMALLFLPVTLRRVLVTSERWRASWILVASPADQARLVLSARNIISIFFLLPYLLFIAALFTYSFGSASHALVHAAYMGMVSYLALQFMVLMSPRLPFSIPMEKDAQGGAMFGIMMVVVIAGMGLYYLLTAVVYRSTLAMLMAAGVFVVLAITMDRLTRLRVRNSPPAAMV